MFVRLFGGSPDAAGNTTGNIKLRTTGGSQSGDGTPVRAVPTRAPLARTKVNRQDLPEVKVIPQLTGKEIYLLPPTHNGRATARSRGRRPPQAEQRQEHDHGESQPAEQEERVKCPQRRNRPLAVESPGELFERHLEDHHEGFR